MSKITVENKKGKIIITNKLSYPEAINERVYNAIASGMLEGFLPVFIKQKRKETKITCIVQGMLPLSQYFNGIVTQKMFLEFVNRVVALIKICDKNMINANNLDLQMDRIFVDPQSKAIQCVFWPIVNNQNEMPPQFFLQQLPGYLNMSPYEDRASMDTYNAFFQGIQPFSLRNFERLILKLQGKQVVSGNKTPSEALPDVSPPSKKSSKNNIEYDPFFNSYAAKDLHKQAIKSENEEDCFCTVCGYKNGSKDNFCANCGTMLSSKTELQKKASPKEGTVVLGGQAGGTTVLGYDAPPQPLFPTLTRDRTQQTFEINKPVYRIGTERKYCDLFICDNNFISRSHADIVTKNDRYYVIDRNSTNKTYVDGKAIPIETEVELFSGTKLRLANEDFTFNITVGDQGGI